MKKAWRADILGKASIQKVEEDSTIQTLGRIAEDPNNPNSKSATDVLTNHLNQKDQNHKSWIKFFQHTLGSAGLLGFTGFVADQIANGGQATKRLIKGASSIIKRLPPPKI